MELRNIDRYFSFEILKREYDYYKKGKVIEIKATERKIIAKISGSSIYRVDIKLLGGEYDIKCTCPYAEDFNCKHMAAVLYCLNSY